MLAALISACKINLYAIKDEFSIDEFKIHFLALLKVIMR